MSGVRIEINQRDFKAIQSKLNALASITDNLKPAFNEIGDYLVSETTQRFADSKSPKGKAWKAVKRNGKPLVKRGHLRDSINYQADNNSVEIGSNVIYAAIHQLGGNAGRGGRINITPRPFLGVNFSDEAEIGDILTRHITRQIA